MEQMRRLSSESNGETRQVSDETFKVQTFTITGNADILVIESS